MRTESFEFVGFGGCTMPAELWLPETEPKALLQITHGMTEHSGRYRSFAEKMTAQGIAVAGFDLRGHGKHPASESVASFGIGGWEASLEDVQIFFKLLDEKLPGIPHYLHGFSLGSFLVREYLGKYPEGIAGAVILGTGNQPGWLMSIMMGIVKGQIQKVDFNGYSPLVRKLSFGTYNRYFKSNRMDIDWLCSDENTLDDYMADPLCRENISAGLFYQMLAAMKRTGGKSGCEGWNRNMPILLICGEQDPVGNMGKGAKAVKKAMEKAGMSVVFHLIPQARHIILGEEINGGAEMTQRRILDFILAK